MCCAGILLAYAYFRSKGGRLRSGPRSIRESFEPEGPEPLT
jgi:hypothetical protein